MNRADYEALRLLPGVRQNGPTQSAKMLAAHTAFRTETDPVRSWLREHVADDPFDSAPRAAPCARPSRMWW